MADESGDLFNGNPKLALYVVLPIFFVLYGGACLGYCTYHIYLSCRTKIKQQYTRRLGVRHMITVFQPSQRRVLDFRSKTKNPRTKSPPPPFEEATASDVFRVQNDIEDCSERNCKTVEVEETNEEQQVVIDLQPEVAEIENNVANNAPNGELSEADNLDKMAECEITTVGGLTN
ncbi:hypothetical protein CAPTEDRAFT_206604 [Capitella teleta]|uniref:Uncharacterized protein n=1 Tax=Capitella teleta TaxID=283909 RepID=R7T4S0_CAPTE|nr:hypothetical protein CAPTEDRAFT_206604 [Capitella teleta]|eukprot:ELT88082.1 hypothetical protein CAPTEDRAFT_206604 [Capitella teleta]